MQRIIRKVLQNASLTVIRNECSLIMDSRWIQVCKDHKRKDNRPFQTARGGCFFAVYQKQTYSISWTRWKSSYRQSPGSQKTA